MYDAPLLTWTVLGPPVGAHRPRVVAGGRRTYMPDPHTRWEYACVTACHARLPPGLLGWQMLARPVALDVVAWHSRPQRLRRKCDPRLVSVPSKAKPDVDNIAKLVMDAATKAGVWTDDTVVADLRVRRRYLPIDDSGQDVGLERVEIRVTALEEG